MLIRCAQLYPLEVPMGSPIRMAGETLTHAHTLLVRLIDAQGREGWGEASAAPLMTGETLGSVSSGRPLMRRHRLRVCRTVCSTAMLRPGPVTRRP